MERKVQEDAQLPFWWKAKSLSYKFAFEDFNFAVSSAANSVSTMLEFTALAAVLTPNLAELVPSSFFCPQPRFLRWSEHIFPRKTPVFIVTQ